MSNESSEQANQAARRINSKLQQARIVLINIAKIDCEDVNNAADEYLEAIVAIDRAKKKLEDNFKLW
jgi:hypothetical protein